MPPIVKRFWHNSSAALQDNWMLLVIALAHTLAAQALAYAHGLPYMNDMAGQGMKVLLRVMPGIMMVFLILRLVYIMRVHRNPRPAAHLLAEVAAFLQDGRRVMSGIFALVAIMSFLSAFSLVKDMIPKVHPFSWDTTFAEIDATLHGGVDPWRLLQPLTNNAYVMAGLSKTYHFWIYLNLFLMSVAAFSPARQSSRRQFLLTYMIVWALVGNIMAIYLSSGGPVYFQGLGLGDRYVDLTNGLQALHQIVPISALDMQSQLWNSYSGSTGFSGISAMPSMHVASTVVMMLYAFSWRRWAGWLMVGFTTVIMIGSVSLGWHYAIDGYLGGATAALVWYAVGFAQKLRMSNKASLAPAE